MNKSRKSARPLGDLIGPCLAAAFARQGFAATELVTHWEDIVGEDIAAHAEPIRLQWPRHIEGSDPQPATLVLRVEGPAAIEIQHLADVILDRVNRFFGWQAVGQIALRQAPLLRRLAPRPLPAFDQSVAQRIADSLTGIEDKDLRAALGRLGAAVRRS